MQNSQCLTSTKKYKTCKKAGKYDPKPGEKSVNINKPQNDTDNKAGRQRHKNSYYKYTQYD